MQGPDDLEITRRDLLSCLDVRFWTVSRLPLSTQSRRGRGKSRGPHADSTLRSANDWK